MLRARETFHHPDGTVYAGDEFGDRDEIVKGREHLFDKAPRKGKGADTKTTDDGDEG